MSSEMPQQAMMDAQQLQKMNEALGSDVRALKKELERARAEKERFEREREEERARLDAIEKERAAERAQMEELARNWNMAKEEKKRGLSEVVEGEVRPFLQKLKEGQSPQLVENLSNFENEVIAKGLDNAFMEPTQMASFATIQAAASQMAATSSKLEEMFQSDKAWAEKYAKLQKERDEVITKNEEALRAAQEEKTLKEKMLDDLKKELDGLKKLHAKNMMSPDNLLEGEEATTDETTAETTTTTTPAVDAPTATVTATASNQQTVSGYNTLLNFNGYKPRTDWRDNRRPGW